MRFLWIIPSVLAVGYLAIALVVYFAQDSLVYFPTHDIVATPADAGMAYTAFTLRTTDGVDVVGWYVPSDRERGVILYCHGNGENVSHRVDLISRFNKLGLSVCAFDYRGYGLSTGTPSEKGTYLDAEAVWRYLVDERGVPASNIILFGHSLGGGVVTRLATTTTPRALILESTFTSMNDMGDKVLPFLPTRLISRYRYDNVANVRRIHVPVLVLHSPDDTVIPYELGRRLFEAANEPKEFVTISGGHDDGYRVSGEAYTEAIDRFLSKH